MKATHVGSATGIRAEKERVSVFGLRLSDCVKRFRINIILFISHSLLCFLSLSPSSLRPLSDHPPGGGSPNEQGSHPSVR